MLPLGTLNSMLWLQFLTEPKVFMMNIQGKCPCVSTVPQHIPCSHYHIINDDVNGLDHGSLDLTVLAHSFIIWIKMDTIIVQSSF